MQLSVEFVNNLVAVLNVLASQVATALDTLNFALVTERNQQSDTQVSPRAPRNSRHGLRQSAFRLIDLALLLEFEPGLWILPPPGTHRPDPRLVRHIGMPLTALLVIVQSQCWIAGHHQGLLLPHPHTADANQDRHRLPHLTRILMVQFVHIQVPHRSALLPRWFMDLGNFYKNSPWPFAMHTVNLLRHGHRVSWMRWFHLQNHCPVPSEAH